MEHVNNGIFFGCYSKVFRNEVSNCSLYSPFGLVERSL